MCPDKSLLSAFYDKEIDEPWLSDIQKHLTSCESCRSRLEEYKEASLFLQKDINIVNSESCDLLYRQVMHQHRRENIIPFWEKRKIWPLTAAALLVLSFSLLLSSPFQRGTVSSHSLVLIENNNQDLSAMDNLVPIMLPPEQKFAYYGDSQLLKAAGFEGGNLP